MDTEKTLSVREVADRCNVTIQTVRIWIKQHKLKANKKSVGKIYVYEITETELKIFMQKLNLEK